MKALEAFIVIDCGGKIDGESRQISLIALAGKQQAVHASANGAAGVADICCVRNFDLRAGDCRRIIGQIIIRVDGDTAIGLQCSCVGNRTRCGDCQVPPSIDGATARQGAAGFRCGQNRVLLGCQVAGDGQVAVGIDCNVRGAGGDVAADANANTIIRANDVDLARRHRAQRAGINLVTDTGRAKGLFGNARLRILSKICRIVIAKPTGYQINPQRI